MSGRLDARYEPGDFRHATRCSHRPDSILKIGFLDPAPHGPSILIDISRDLSGPGRGSTREHHECSSCPRSCTGEYEIAACATRPSNDKLVAVNVPLVPSNVAVTWNGPRRRAPSKCRSRIRSIYLTRHAFWAWSPGRTRSRSPVHSIGGGKVPVGRASIAAMIRPLEFFAPVTQEVSPAEESAESSWTLFRCHHTRPTHSQAHSGCRSSPRSRPVRSSRHAERLKS